MLSIKEFKSILGHLPYPCQLVPGTQCPHLDETELRIFCGHYSLFPSFTLPLIKIGIEKREKAVIATKKCTEFCLILIWRAEKETKFVSFPVCGLSL